MRRPPAYPAPVVAEELQYDEDAEREAGMLELLDYAEAFRRIGIAFAVLFLATFVAIAIGRVTGLCG